MGIVVYLRIGTRACHIADAYQSACWLVGRHCSDLDIFWLLAVLAAVFEPVFEPVAFAIHLENVDVMGQTIQQRTS